jgi:uncharacterized protein (DUF58 family)
MTSLAERRIGLTAGSRRELPITWQLSGHARRLATLTIAGLFFAVITRRAEFAGLAAPALLLLIGYRAERPSSIEAELGTGAELMTEGEQGAVLLRLTGIDAAQAHVRLRPAPWITGGDAELGDDGWYLLPFVPQRWGIRPVGTIEVRIWDRWRLTESRLTVSVPRVICHPRPAVLDSLVVLHKLPARLGEHTSRRPGEGIEFAGVRDFVPGDRQRRINWPATTRRGTLQLNVFTAERAQSVVVLMDVSTDVGEPGRSSADLAVRAAAGTAMRYLAARDRVGLISFGHELQWIAPAVGRRQADRIMNLIMTTWTSGYPLEMVSALPHTAMPPGALVIVFSPLLSLRLVEALRELRERGFAVIVVDVLLTQLGASTGAWRYRVAAELARRIWRMEQEAIRFSLREIGIPVVPWDGQAPLDEPLAPYTRRPVVNG